MEVFEEKSHVDRQLSSASARLRRNSRIGYILTMAGIILITCVVLLGIHFSREYNFLSKEIARKTSNSKSAEMLERRTCEVPFCNTKDCVFVAASMQESMNLKANPCTDFYEYSCGGYRRTKAVPYASDHYSPAKEAQEDLLIDIRKSLEKIMSDSGGTAVAKMKRFYDSCLNSTQRDEVENRTLSSWFSDLKLVPLNYVLGNAFDFEPLVQWPEIVSNLEQYQIHTLFKPHFVATKDTAPQKLEVDCLVPFLNPETYSNSSDDELAFQLIMFKESMNSALELLNMDRATRHEFVDDVMKIEMDIAKVASTADSESHSYLSQEHKQQLKTIWQPVVGNAVQDMEVVSTCKYDLQDILTILNQAPNKKVIKYIMWKMLMQTMQYMGTEFRSLHIHYMTKIPEFDYANEIKWRECTDVIRSELGLVAMKELFDNGYFQKETLDVINAEFMEMKRNVALMFSSLIHGVDQSFAEKFLDKVKYMKLETGYLEKINQVGFLDTIYSEMDIGDEYFSNILELKRFKARRKFLKLWYQNNADSTNAVSLEHSPLDNSASYDYITNTIHIDLGVFRPPYFRHSNEIPEYVTYGFSTILAREMVKAFDITGSHYDAKGQRFEKIWWPSTIENKFNEFLTCIKDQMTSSGSNAIGEVDETKVINNIMADMGTFFVPYEGLKGHLKSHMSEKPLPGLPLNKKQTFYVQAAQMFCEIRGKPSSNPESKFLLPPKLRVNIAASNMEDFVSVFNCPVASSMNLQNKCNLFNFLPDER